MGESRFVCTRPRVRPLVAIDPLHRCTLQGEG